MKITKDSHTDHALTALHLELAVKVGEGKEGFFIETVTLPDEVLGLPCGLHGPSTTGQVIPEEEVEYAIRGNRRYASRLTSRPTFLSREMTVIGGIHNGEMILFTAYGGPRAPCEPGDISIQSWEDVCKSRNFWATHALSKG